MIKYSPSIHACYDTRLGYPSLPDDLIAISADEYAFFLSPPPGKRVKPHTYPFEYEDVPGPDLVALAEQTRDEAIESNIVLTGTGAEFQIDVAARGNIAVAIRKSETDGYPDTESRDWRLADNSWRKTTLSELKQLLNQYDERFESVWYQFNIWDLGDRLEPFEVEL